MDTILFFAIITIIAVLISILMRFLKQPLLIGYIITGIIVNFFGLINYQETLDLFSQFGIALLLFIVGLNLNPKSIKELGFVSLATGLGQIILTLVISFIASLLLGFSITFSAYISIALSFSSTIIIMKFLSDKNDLDTVYGRILIGILLVQDLVAVMLMLIIPSLNQHLPFTEVFFGPIIKGAGVIALLFSIGYFIFPKVDRFIAKSQEFLFLFSIAWCFIIAASFEHIGFSLEIGALLAGISLSMLPIHYEISAKISPLRDFFLIIFFVALGTKINFHSITNVFALLVFSLIIIIIKPLIVLFLVSFIGYTRRNSFLSAISLGQISEFSIILFTLGYKLGHINSNELSSIGLLALISMTVSSYFIKYNHRTFSSLKHFLKFLPDKKEIVDGSKSKRYDLVLFGYNRIGFDLLESFKKLKGKKYLVVDFNPDVVVDLAKKGIECQYGDASDEAFLDNLNLMYAKMIISTVPNFEANCLLVRKIRAVNDKAIIIVVSSNLEDTFTLYDLGATYVLTPQFLGGKFVADMIERYGFKVSEFHKERKRHIIHLHKRKEQALRKPEKLRHYYSV